MGLLNQKSSRKFENLLRMILVLCLGHGIFLRCDTFIFLQIGFPHEQYGARLP